MNAKRLRILAGLSASFALFLVAVFKVDSGGGWYWFALLAGSYLIVLYSAARLGWTDGDGR